MENSLSIVLRALEPEDIDLLYKWENDKNIWQVSNTLVPFSRYTLTKYIESSHVDIYQAKQLRLMIDVVEQDMHTTVGTIDLFDFEPYHSRAGLGILIGEEAERGKGYAKAALLEVIDYAFETLNLNQLYCNIGLNNEVSLNLFTSIGFIGVGRKRKWNRTPDGFEDEVILQLFNEKE